MSTIRERTNPVSHLPPKSLPKSMKGRCAIGYVRSESKEDPIAALRDATPTIENYCCEREIELLAILFDSDIDSYKEFSDRPGGSQLIRLSRELGAKNIVVPALRSAFKDTVDAARHVKSWRSKRIKLHIVDLGGEPFVNEKEVGTGFNKALAGLAAIERLNIGERIAGSQMKRKALGLVYSSTPYGADRHGPMLVKNEAEQAVIKRMKQMHKAGSSYRQIAEHLNDEGVPTKKAKKWYPTTVRNIIHNDVEAQIRMHESQL